MLSKRKEPFRYTFDQPIDCLFEISEVNEHKVSSSKGEAHIVNLSPNGIKMLSSLKIPIKNNKAVFLTISFSLNDREMKLVGEIVWMKRWANKYEYGITLNESKNTKNMIIEQLKQYAKQQRSQS